MKVATLAPHARRLGNYAVTLAAGLGQIVAAVYLSRQAFKFFDEQDLKIWFLMLATMPFLALFELGANVVLPHKLAAVNYEAEGISKIASNFIATVCLVLASVTLIGGIVLCLCVEFGWLATYVASLLAALGLASGARILANVMHSLLYAEGDNFFDKSLRVVAILVMTAVISVSLHFGWALWAMPIGWTAAALTSICTSLYRQHTRWRVLLSLRYLRRDDLVATLREALQYVFIALPGQLVFNATPFIVASRLPAQYTVAFGLTQQLVGGISLIVGLPVTIATPRLAGTFQVNKARARALLLSIMANSGVISAAALSLVAVSVDQITMTWVGHQVPIDAVFLSIYFLVMFIEWQQTAATTATMATGDLNFATVTVTSAILVVTMMPVFIGYIGFVGVPITLLVAQMLTCHPHNFWKAFRTYHINLSGYLPKLMPALLVAGFVIGASAILRELGLPALIHLLVAGTVTALLCATGLLMNRTMAKSLET